MMTLQQNGIDKWKREKFALNLKRNILISIQDPNTLFETPQGYMYMQVAIMTMTVPQLPKRTKMP